MSTLDSINFKDGDILHAEPLNIMVQEILNKEPLVGTTEEITPSQVFNAITAEHRNAVITAPFGDEETATFTAFTILDSYIVFSADLVKDGETFNTLVLIGSIVDDEWAVQIDNLMAPSPGALTFTGAVSGTYNGSEAVTIDIPTVAGEKGENGYSPVRGVDYWTEVDQEAIVQQVITALGTPVFGTVDENNTITLRGDLADGTYTIAYEYKDGTIGIVGEFSEGVTYTNLLPSAVGYDGSIFNGTGYIDGYRLQSANHNSNTALLSAIDGYFVTGWIPYTIEQAVAKTPIYFKGISFDLSNIPQYMRLTMVENYNENVYCDSLKFTDLVTNGRITLTQLGENYYKMVPLQLDQVAGWGSRALQYIRFSFYGTGAGVIITVDEPIE